MSKWERASGRRTETGRLKVGTRWTFPRFKGAPTFKQIGQELGFTSEVPARQAYASALEKMRAHMTKGEEP